GRNWSRDSVRALSLCDAGAVLWVAVSSGGLCHFQQLEHAPALELAAGGVGYKGGAAAVGRTRILPEGYTLFPGADAGREADRRRLDDRGNHFQLHPLFVLGVRAWWETGLAR